MFGSNAWPSSPSFETLVELWDCKMIYTEFLIYWIFSSSSKLSVKINQVTRKGTLAFIEHLSCSRCWRGCFACSILTVALGGRNWGDWSNLFMTTQLTGELEPNPWLTWRGSPFKSSWLLESNLLGVIYRDFDDLVPLPCHPAHTCTHLFALIHFLSRAVSKRPAHMNHYHFLSTPAGFMPLSLYPASSSFLQWSPSPLGQPSALM